MPTSSSGYVQFLASQGNSEKAEAALKTFIEQNPDAGKLRLALGQLYETTDRPEEARKAYAALGERAPKSVEGLAARNRVAAIDIRSRQGRGRARRDRQDPRRTRPTMPSALLLRSGLRFTENKFDDAIADLRLVLRKEPDNDRALLLLAQAYVRQNELALAKDTYRRLLEVAPDSPDGLQQLAVLYASNKEYAEAEALLRKRLEQAARRPGGLGPAGRSPDGPGAARRRPRKRPGACRRSTNQTGVGDFSLGRVLAQKKDYDAAADAFRKSVDARAGDPLPLEGLVRSLLAAGKKDEAIGVLNQQLEQRARTSCSPSSCWAASTAARATRPRPSSTWRTSSRKSRTRSSPGHPSPASTRTGTSASPSTSGA